MQNINLFQTQAPQRSGPQPVLMGLGAALVVLLALLHAAWTGWQLSEAEQAAAQAEQQAQAGEATLAELSGAALPQPDPTLPGQLAGQQASNDRLARVAEYLEVLDAQRSGGFVPVLQGLAERHPPAGLWLTRIVLDDGGQRLSLEGLAQRQALLPAYLHSLGQHPAFGGRTFGQFDVTREDSGLLRFELSSRAEAEPSDE